MIGSIAVLLLMQLLGTLLVQASGLPFPGPVVGMLLLFAWLLWRGGVPRPLARTTQPLLDNLALLFVPAGVGIIAHWRAVEGRLWALALVLIVAAAITLLTTAWTLHWLLGRHAASASDDADEPWN